MALTKHLYRFEEVKAALLYSIKQGRYNESFFWLEELEESCYGNEARHIVLLSWIMRIGIKRLSWLEEWAKISSTREGRHRLCWQLIRCTERDSSIWLLLWSLFPSSIPTVPGRLFTEWRSSCKKEEEDFWQSIVNASDDERIDSIYSALQDTDTSYSIFVKACALTISHGYKHIQSSTWAPLSTLEPPYEANTEQNQRFARVYEIPKDCLYGMTQRGAGTSTIEELRRLGEKDFRSSPYWKTKYPLNGNDDTIEQFWDTYFPGSCDHPDEWSAEQQSKSHGIGIPIGPLSRWWTNWIENEHLFLWGTIQYAILKYIQTQKTSSVSIFETLTQFYDTYTCDKKYQNYTIKKEFILDSS